MAGQQTALAPHLASRQGTPCSTKNAFRKGGLLILLESPTVDCRIKGMRKAMREPVKGEHTLQTFSPCCVGRGSASQLHSMPKAENR